MKSINIRGIVAYDGTNFCGWQLQKEDRTVQGEVESALERMHGRRVPVTAAGRTDSGVHALGQVINFRTDIENLEPERYFLALNSFLPWDVRVLSSEQVENSFHSRYDARSRTYRFNLNTSAVCLPQYKNYCYHVRKPLDITLLNRYASVLTGEHDFTTFSVPRDSSKTRIRRISSAAFFTDGPYIVFTITGNAFLWKMVRSLVGTMLDLEKEGAAPDRFREILEGKDRALAGVTAPPHGLFMMKVEYEE